MSRNGTEWCPLKTTKWRWKKNTSSRGRKLITGRILLHKEYPPYAPTTAPAIPPHKNNPQILYSRKSVDGRERSTHVLAEEKAEQRHDQHHEQREALWCTAIKQ
jgi:deoxyribodipyrimidine photolyase-like uncharacterized protein